jgi:hypothetical protein
MTNALHRPLGDLELLSDHRHSHTVTQTLRHHHTLRLGRRGDEWHPQS